MNFVRPVPDRTSQPAGWVLWDYHCVDSTNLVAAGLPAWQAVRSITQTAGRGRFQRTWISDEGGLWLSAVVPLAESREQIQTLPLAAGLAVIEALAETGLRGARLRWPNDIMIGDRKIAGILVDSFSPHTAVIGIGVNVTNRPAAADPSLRNVATRLADLLPQPPALDLLTERILSELRVIIGQLLSQGFSALSPRINQLWGGQCQVRLDLDGLEKTGLFLCVDARGRLLLEDEQQDCQVFAPHQVRLFREV